jgi:AraC-like DNA-binding protein
MSIKAMSGITANEWIWRYLHLASRELLQKTGLSATEISEKLGFSSLNTFTRYFYRMEGRHPKEYIFRKNYCKQLGG